MLKLMIFTKLFLVSPDTRDDILGVVFFKVNVTFCVEIVSNSLICICD